MSHFYGTVNGQAGEATRRGSKLSGLTTYAASWRGAISVSLHHDDASGEDRFSVHQTPWKGSGISQEIMSGVLGQKSYIYSLALKSPQQIERLDHDDATETD